MSWFVDWTPPELVSDGKKTHTKYIAYSYYITCGNTLKISVFCAGMKNEWLGINLSKFYEKTCLWPIWSKFLPAIYPCEIIWKFHLTFQIYCNALVVCHNNFLLYFCTFNKIKTWQIYIAYIIYVWYTILHHYHPRCYPLIGWVKLLVIGHLVIGHKSLVI